MNRRRVLMHYDGVLTYVRKVLENTLYYFTDYYYCSYACLLLPNPDKLQYFVIGPYTYVEIVIYGNFGSMPYARDYMNETEKSPYLTPANMSTTEARYAFENQLIQAVSHGNLTQIDQLLSKENGIRYIPRLTNALRDYKNYMVVLNTLLRKAAEQGGVHPVYLDQISSKFAQKIETMTSVSDHSLEREMLHKYCLLVRNHSN